MTLLQSAFPGTNNKERVPQEVVNLKGSFGSSGGTDVNVYFEDKLRSVSEGDIQRVVEVSEESMAKTLGGRIVSVRVFVESIRVDAVGDLE